MPRDAAIAKLVPVFQQYGYEGATLSRLAAASGLGRASLYHHFPKGKEEIAAAVLAHVREWWATQIFAPLGDREVAPRERLERFGEGVVAYYEGGEGNCLLNTMTLGTARDLFHQQVTQSLQGLIAALAAVAIEAGVDAAVARQRAEDAVIQIQGSLVLARGLQDTAPFQRAIAGLPDFLLAESLG